MHIIHGTYHFARKLTGYRNDYCLNCESQRMAEEWQTFDALHLFLIPVLPLGSHRRWHCTVCNRDPHERVKTTKGVKITGLFCCLCFGILPWAAAPTGDDLQGAILMSALSLAAFIYLIHSICTEQPSPGLEEQLKLVPPLTGDNCAYCGAPLIQSAIAEMGAQCGACGVRRHQVS